MDSQRSKNLSPLLHTTPIVVLLSGTPQLALPAELYVQFSAMIHPAKMTYKEFTKRYCGGKFNRFGAWEAREAHKTLELTLVLKTFMVRRFACDVLTQLPLKTREVVEMFLPPAALAVLAEIQDRLAQARKRVRDSSASADKRAKYDVDLLKQVSILLRSPKI